jgi:hypothetical protein
MFEVLAISGTVLCMFKIRDEFLSRSSVESSWPHKSAPFSDKILERVSMSDQYFCEVFNPVESFEQNL